LYPANLDPRFAGQGVPDSYLTSLPGSRGVFYYAPSVDPLVLALAEATKETVTTAELATALPALGLSSAIHVPMLVVGGDYDAAFCGEPTCSASGSLDDEAGFFPPDACVETAAIANAGHDLNLHFQAPLTYDVVPPPSPCP
jgi:hypothetical protein